MKTKNILNVCGSITKKESLVPVTSNILEHTWVEEANLPYANYYGQVPEKPKSNSLFLFTSKYYSLEEILYSVQNITSCFNLKLNVASATLEINNKQYPAIRVKNFPDYKQLHLLQKCFMQQGILWAQKIHLITEAKAIINKCFELEQIEENIYIDLVEENKGYIFIENYIDRNNFDQTILKIKRNSNCMFFDAVPGGLIIDSQSKNIVRIFSEHLKHELLRCIKDLLKEYLK